MTLEEAIRHYEESEKLNKQLAEICVSPIAKNHNLENAEKCRQMIEWLSELHERRKQSEIVHCGECRFNVSSHKCLHPESFFLVPDDDFYCGYAERRTDG